MNKCIRILLLVLLLDSRFLFAQADKHSLQTYRLLFQTTVEKASFSFDSVYQNHSGETFTVRSFRYYVSHIRFVYDDGKAFAISQPPHLINEADSASRNIQIAIPKGTIIAIHFLLGIDSANNVAGVQSGDLDPAKGMFWVWNTGYIMAKLEGASPSSKAPGKQYSYDIGGYKPGENAAREIKLTIPSAINHQLSTFIITADIGKWFYGKHDVRIGGQPMCHSPGTLAMQIADNYAAMFSVRAQ